MSYLQGAGQLVARATAFIVTAPAPDASAISMAAA